MARSVTLAVFFGGAALMLSACGGPTPASPVTSVASGLTMLDSGKGITDHLVSNVVGQDCILMRVFSGEPICRDVHHDVDVPDGMELITTARRPIFVSAPEEQVAEGGARGDRPFLTDTAIWRGAGIDSTDEIQQQVAMNASALFLPSDQQFAGTTLTPSDILDLEIPLQGSLEVAEVDVEILAPITLDPSDVTPVLVAHGAMPVPPVRPDFASLVAARVAVEPVGTSPEAALPLQLASANPPPVLITVPVLVASADALAPLPPRRPGWFDSVDAFNQVAALSGQ